MEALVADIVAGHILRATSNCRVLDIPDLRMDEAHSSKARALAAGIRRAARRYERGNSLQVPCSRAQGNSPNALIQDGFAACQDSLRRQIAKYSLQIPCKQEKTTRTNPQVAARRDAHGECRRNCL